MIKPFFIILMLVLTIAVPAQAQSSPLAGSAWYLVAYGSGSPLPQEAHVTLIFGADDSVGGFGGCNSYGGNYTINGDTISFNGIISTLMACAEEIMTVEQAYLNGLQTATNYHLKDGQLIIAYDGGALTFEPIPSLDSAQWHLTTLNGAPILADSAITILFEDGRLSGVSGCNSYGGDYALNGLNIQLGALFSTERACLNDALMAQERAYLAALAGAQSYQISGNELRIYSTEGQLIFMKSPTLYDSRWRLVAHGEAIATPAQPIITLAFSIDGHISGFGGCNSYNAPYEVDDANLTIGPIASTKKACLDDNLMMGEQAYFSALQSAMRYELSDEQLIIFYSDGTLVFEPIAELAGSQWQLNAIEEYDDGVTTSLIISANITLNFGADGSVGGFGGCNSYGGNYTINGDTISFNGIISTLMACAEEIMTVEQAYLNGLQTATNYHLKDGQLIIAYDGGALIFSPMP